jgi:hypothetical protein
MCEGCKSEEEKLKLTLLKKNYFGGKGHMDSFKCLGFWKW